MNTTKYHKKVVWILIIVAAVALVLVIFSFMYPNLAPTQLSRSYDRLRHLEFQNIAINTHQHLTLSDIPTIQSWMTFYYLNEVFALPPNYLEASLNISDPHYPNLTIKHYARENKIGAQTLLETIQSDIANYLKSR